MKGTKKKCNSSNQLKDGNIPLKLFINTVTPTSPPAGSDLHKKTESYFFHRQTAPSVYSSPKAQHRSLFIHNFPQQCPSFSIPHTFRNRPKKLVARLTSLHQPPLTKSRPIWSDPIRAQHFQHYTSVRPFVLPLVRISPEGLTVKYIFVMVACPCPGWFWQLNSATNTPPDHRPR